MIGAWMLHAIAVATLAALAAAALDRLLRPHRLPVRWAWAGALVLGALWPAARLLLPAGGAATGASEAVPGGLPVAVLDVLTVTVGGGSLLRRLDPALVGVWAVLSLGMLALGARALLRLRRLRRRWRPARIRGTDVLLSEEAGPAVVGVTNPRVVLPSWLAEGGEGAPLDLVLRHERQHLTARDPALLAVAHLVLAAVPWNPALWWTVRRLREAVEVDCDARVLERAPGTLSAYAETLLDVSARGPGGVGVPALVEPRSFLERRILAMTSDTPKHRALRALALGSLALLALSGACLAPAPGADGGRESPVEVAGDASGEQFRSASDLVDKPVHTPYTDAPDIRNRGEVARAMENAYPARLQDAGVEGRAQVWFLIDREGATREVRLRESSGHEALDRAALEVAGVFDFTPALNGGERVPVWLALPISFRLD